MDAKTQLSRRAASNERSTTITEQRPGFGGNPMGGQVRLSRNTGLMTDKIINQMDSSMQMDFVQSFLQATDVSSKSPVAGGGSATLSNLLPGGQTAPSGLSLVHAMNTGGRFTPGRRHDLPVNPYKRAQYEKQ